MPDILKEFHDLNCQFWECDITKENKEICLKCRKYYHESHGIFIDNSELDKVCKNCSELND